MIGMEDFFSFKMVHFQGRTVAHKIYVWYIYLHLVDFYGKLVDKYTKSYNSPMDWF